MKKGVDMDKYNMRKVIWRFPLTLWVITLWQSQGRGVFPATYTPGSGVQEADGCLAADMKIGGLGEGKSMWELKSIINH